MLSRGFLTKRQSAENPCLSFINSQDTYGHESAEFALEEVLQLTVVQLVFVTFFSRIGVKHLDEAPNSHFQGGGRVTRFFRSLLGHFFCLTINTCKDKSRKYNSHEEIQLRNSGKKKKKKVYIFIQKRSDKIRSFHRVRFRSVCRGPAAHKLWCRINPWVQKPKNFFSSGGWRKTKWLRLSGYQICYFAVVLRRKGELVHWSFYVLAHNKMQTFHESLTQNCQGNTTTTLPKVFISAAPLGFYLLYVSVFQAHHLSNLWLQ